MGTTTNSVAIPLRRPRASRSNDAVRGRPGSSGRLRRFRQHQRGKTMRTVVLIHGALGSASQLAPIAALLGDAYEVLSLELEGHGDTPGAADDFHIDRFAQN